MALGRTRRKPALITDVKVENSGLNLTYPKVSGLKHKSAESGINRYIKKEVHKILKEEGYGRDENKKFTGGYTVKLNKRGTISINIDVYHHIKGEERGATIRKTINVSLKDARVYHLNDLFSRRIKKSKLIGILNELIKNQISFKSIKLEQEFESINFDQSYYLTENSLVIYFPACELKSFEFNFPEFEIPFLDIEDIINTKGPIGRLLRDKEENNNNEETADE
jgi:hypothetical protein